MHIDEKLDFLIKYADQSRQNTNNNISNNSDILKSCLYQISSLNLAHLLSSQQHLPNIQQGSYINLPKIKTKNSFEKEQTAKSLLTQGRLLLNSFSKNQQYTKINFYQTSLNPISLSSKVLKQNRSKPRAFFRKARKGLSKQERYFQTRQVMLDKQTVNQLGLYESGNLFQTKNIKQNIKQLKIIAQKPQFSPIKLANKHDLFLTNIMPDAADFCVEHFIDQELGRDRSSSNIIPQYESREQSLSQKNLEGSINSTNIVVPPATIQQTFIYLTFRNYDIVEDQSYKIFKIRHLENWGQIKMNIFMIKKCLQIHKINQISIKENNLIFWQGVRITEFRIKQLLGISTMVRSTEKVSRTVLAFRDKLKVALMKKVIQRRESLARWVVLRLKTLVNLSKVKQQKINKALKLHHQLRENPKWQVQIHIPSFSVQCFKRNTTQYMESFEAHYHSLWDSSPFPLILVLPTLNENILKLLQSRIKVTRSVTIITPQIHQLFPLNLSLAAQVLFSHQTLAKIEKAVAGRKAVIIGGTYQDPTYELMISEQLNAPLFCSLTVTNNAEQQKRLFLQSGLKIMDYCVINKKTSIDGLLQQFATLLLKNIGDKSWVFKIKGQFRGRGIATFQFNTAKYINSENSVDKNKILLIEILRTTLRLKLKVNFQNSLYMVEDYLQSFREIGGIIEQFIETSATYELCFVKHEETELISLFRVYGINFANKVWLSAHLTPQIATFVSNFLQIIQQGDYLGHLSITIIKTLKGDFVGVDVKLGKTAASSATPFLSMLQETKLQSNTEAINIALLPTQRSDPLTDKSQEPSCLQSRFLLIPTLPFTDIQDATKSKFIEDVMVQCWSDRHLKLGEEGRLFLSMGLDFAGVITGRDLKRLKKLGIQLVRELTERTSSLKQYRGKEVVRDVFQYGDVIRAISMIRNED